MSQQQQQGAPLPKFGEWDVNNPATADGFTVIFNKARDEKKTPPTNTMTNPPVTPPPKNGRGEGSRPDHDYEHKRKSWWSCFG